VPPICVEYGTPPPRRWILQQFPTRGLDSDLVVTEQHMHMRRLERKLPAVDDE
jgi:hypothetical protein